MDPELKNILMGLLHITPFLLVYLLAAIMGMVNLNRHKTPALLAMLGGMLAGVVMLGSFIFFRVMYAQLDKGDIEDHQKMFAMLDVVGIGTGLLEAVGTGMIVFAVFAGRKAISRDRYDDRDSRDRRDDRGRRDDRDDRPRA